MPLTQNNQANESLSQYKLLSAYGGAGSLLHTQYGSIMVSCLEEWGFLNRAIEALDGIDLNDEAEINRALAAEGLKRSKDWRLLEDLRTRKNLPNLNSLVLIPTIDVDERFNTIQDGNTPLAINSTYMPKNFIDEYTKSLKPYGKWRSLWTQLLGQNTLASFFPPKKVLTNDQNAVLMDGVNPRTAPLKQDNVVLICENGHISSMPWANYLNWKRNNVDVQQEGPVDLFGIGPCCGNPDIRIRDNQGNTAGFDGKFLSCKNEGCGPGVSLKGLFNIKVACPGHKPWEANTGGDGNYFGHAQAVNQDPPLEACSKIMKIVLTTGNNIYYSRNISSIYMPAVLYMNHFPPILDLLTKQEQQLFLAGMPMDQTKALAINLVANQIYDGMRCDQHPLWAATVTEFNAPTLPNNDGQVQNIDLDQAQQTIQYRYEEFEILTNRSDSAINVDKDRLFVKDVTDNLADALKKFFKKVLRVDQLMVTTTQLDFSRDRPVDADANNSITPKNIFRSLPQFVRVYPAVESFGEGIFFAFDDQLIGQASADPRFFNLFSRQLDSFGQASQEHAVANGIPLYIIHSFSHLIMRELEFQCGYPTASLSERLYISNEEDTKMYGVMIYTSEGAEGSMGGLIAQTRPENLNKLIERALERATICSSDPLCWESEGQGLFELNLASCFSCGLVSETSCEKRNMYLDRRILVDEDFGIFREVIYQNIAQEVI